jgi:hypothetical protein
LANAGVFEDRGKGGGGLSALTVGGYDDVADSARVWIERTNAGLNGSW